MVEDQSSHIDERKVFVQPGSSVEISGIPCPISYRKLAFNEVRLRGRALWPSHSLKQIRAGNRFLQAGVNEADSSYRIKTLWDILPFSRSPCERPE